jgi:nucleoside-diphosphate-sugar epimerase/carbamoylphosphate synthase large subunit
VTAVGGGIGQSVLQSLHNTELNIRRIGMDVRPLSLGLYWTDSAYLVPPVSEQDSYIKQLTGICIQEHLDILIPGLDLELPILSLYQNHFLKLGCKVVISSPEVIKLCRDKYLFYKFCRERNLPFVATYKLKEAQIYVNKLTFPIIVKPYDGSASVGAHLCYNEKELLNISPEENLIVQTYLPPEKIPLNDKNKLKSGHIDQSNEISIQFFVSPSGKILGKFASINRLKFGVPIEIIPDQNSPAIEAGLPIVSALISKGLRGPINLQGRLTPDGVYFFEANPRFTGISGLRALFGYREVEAAIWAFIMEKEQQAYDCLSYVPGYLGIRYFANAIVPAESVRKITLTAKKETSFPNTLSDKTKNVLVTGASGYIGSNIISHLLSLPDIHEVKAAVRSKSKGFELINLLGNPKKLKIVIGEIPENIWLLDGIDIVIHTAAIRQLTDPENPSEFFRVNSLGVHQLIKAMHNAGVKQLIYLSSQSVYGNQRPPLWSEALSAQPDTPYGLSKWMGELVCLNNGWKVPQTIILRPARVYGFGHFMRWDELPHKFSFLVSRGQSLSVYRGGKEKIDLLHIQDLTNAITKICRQSLSGYQNIILNIGSGHAISVSHLANLCQVISKEMGLKVSTIKYLNDRPKEIHRNWGMDIRRAKTYLNWEPNCSLKDGLTELFNALLKNKALGN